MQTQTQQMRRFFREWNAEFIRAVEMFTGEVPEVTCAPFAGAAQEQEALDQYLWWRQSFDGQTTATAWIGAPLETWTTVGSGMGDGADGARDIYLEMLGQSLQGTAHVVSAGLPTPLTCSGGQIGSAPSMASLELAEVGITLHGSQLPSMIVAVEPSLVLATNTPDPTPEPPISADHYTTPRIESEIMLDRLADLDLPMSVALGRSVLAIRDVLKFSAGSLVELVHHAGDSVEVLIHGTVVARGQVVTVKGNYAIRIQEIISQRERLALQRKDARIAPPAPARANHYEA